eukprot:6993392-Pyramimonas_sp.AAC.1
MSDAGNACVGPVCRTSSAVGCCICGVPRERGALSSAPSAALGAPRVCSARDAPGANSLAPGALIS